MMPNIGEKLTFSDIIIQRMKNYWICDTDLWLATVTPDEPINTIKIGTNHTIEMRKDLNSVIWNSMPVRRPSKLPKIDAKLRSILDKISKDKFPSLESKAKSLNWMGRNRSSRRSQFIGVSK